MPSRDPLWRHPARDVVRTAPQKTKSSADENTPDAFSRGTEVLDTDHGAGDHSDHQQCADDFPTDRPPLLGTVKEMNADRQQKGEHKSRHGVTLFTPARSHLSLEQHAH